MLDDRRMNERLAAMRERMHDRGVELPDSDMPRASTAWAEARAEGVTIHFRTTRVGFVPYVEVPLEGFAGLFTGRLPLPQVTQGPAPDPELSLESLSMYLESRGYGSPHTEVKASGIPLRT